MVTLPGTTGNDSLVGTTGADSITGLAGNDSLYGGAGVDSLYGGDGNDLLIGGAGGDRLFGGAGNDLVDYAASTAGVSVNLATGAGTGGDAAGDTFNLIENVSGSAFNDTLTGDGNANALSGAAGADSITAGAGNDSLYGGDGNDSLIGGAGADVIEGGLGIDSADYSASLAGVTVNLTTGAGAGGDAANDSLSGIEVLIGSAAADSLTGDAGANSLYGGGGADTLAGGGGADYLDGSTGTDTADYAASGAAVSLNLATGIYSGGDAAGDSLVGFENLTGSAFNDTMTGDGNANILIGNAGDDAISAGAGTDSLYGGDGNDTLTGGAGADALFGGAGVDTASYTASTAAVNVNLTGAANTGGDAAGDTLNLIENLEGSAFNDTLTGGTGANYLWGGAGNDLINAGDGNDTLSGGAGADTLYGGAQMDFIDYSASNAAVNINLSTWTATGGHATGDVLAGTDGVIGSNFDDTIIGFNDQGLTGDVYTNEFYGGGGNDYIDGMGSNDALYGGADNDSVLGGAGDDSNYGGTGNDSVDGGLGNDQLYGGDGNDIITGGDGADVLYGGDGNDSMYGGAGNDTFRGGVGDVLYGGTGDVLDLTGLAPYKIVRDPLNPGNGTVTFYGPGGEVLGTLQFYSIGNVVSCFTPGTKIVTPRGEVLIQDLQVGDHIVTRDSGAQVIRWIGSRRITRDELRVDASLKPILINAGALGYGLPEQDMMVSRQHRMLFSGSRAELLFGTDEVLVRAAHLLDMPGVSVAAVEDVTYIHLLFDKHEVILANGAWSESFQPGDLTLEGMEAGQREEIFKIFPHLADSDVLAKFDAARTTLKAYEARVLLAA